MVDYILKLRIILLAAAACACSTEVANRRVNSALNSSNTSADNSKTVETADSSQSNADAHDDAKGKQTDDSQQQADMPQWVNGVPLTCWYDALDGETNVVVACNTSAATQPNLPPAADQPTSYAWSLRDLATRDIIGAILKTSTPDGSLSRPAHLLAGSEIVLTAADGAISTTVSASLDKLPGGAALLDCLRTTLNRSDNEQCFRDAGVTLPSDRVELVQPPPPPPGASPDPSQKPSTSPSPT